MRFKALILTVLNSNIQISYERYNLPIVCILRLIIKICRFNSIGTPQNVDLNIMTIICNTECHFAHFINYSKWRHKSDCLPFQTPNRISAGTFKDDFYSIFTMQWRHDFVRLTNGDSVLNVELLLVERVLRSIVQKHCACPKPEKCVMWFLNNTVFGNFTIVFSCKNTLINFRNKLGTYQKLSEAYR